MSLLFFGGCRLEKISLGQKMKRLIKRYLTPTWFKHVTYQFISFIISLIILVGVITYAINKSYDEVKLHLPQNFLVSTVEGSFEQDKNSIDWITYSINNNVGSVRLEVRQSPDGNLVVSDDLVVTNNNLIKLEDVFKLFKNNDVMLDINVKEARILNPLYNLLVEYNLLERTYLTGINSFNINDVKESNCKSMNYFIDMQPSRLKIFDNEYCDEIIEKINESGAIGVNCNYNYIGGRLSEVLHKNGYKLIVDSVNEKYSIKRILTSKPDVVLTKDYDRVISTINNWGK